VRIISFFEDFDFDHSEPISLTREASMISIYTD
jgi:hypothetical protein